MPQPRLGEVRVDVVGGLEGLDEVLDTADGLLLAVLEVTGHQHTSQNQSILKTT